MKRFIKIIEGKKQLGTGTIKLTKDKIVLWLPSKLLSIPFSDITLFDDSLTTTSRDERLDELSFLLEFKHKTQRRSLFCYVLNKEETEKSFLTLVQMIRKHLPLRKENISSYYRTYGVRRDLRYLAHGVFGIPMAMIILVFMIRILKREIVRTQDFLLIPAVFLVIVISWKYIVGKKITVNEKELIFESMWMKKVIPYDSMVKFVKDLSTLKGERVYLYRLYYRKNSYLRRVTFAYNFTENTSALIYILKHKLKHLPQVTLTGLPWNRKEKPWSFKQTY